MTSRAALPYALAAALAGCDDRADTRPNGAAFSAPLPAPASQSTASPSGSAAAPQGELKALRLVFTSEVKDKSPVDDLDAAKPGQRVYAHLTARNRTGAARRIALVFRVDGDERSRVELTVEPSWSYRTWGYVTLRAADHGELVVDARDEAGEALATRRLPIAGESRKKPETKGPPPDDL